MAHAGTYSQLEASSVERRHAIRYELQIPVAFFWENATGGKFQGEGVTRDISEAGVYVFTEECPPPKSKVRVEIMLAQPGIASASLKGKMQVRRVEATTEKSGRCGFALGGKTFSLSSTSAAQA
jgi:hypothetical protein